jgi:hypothetical protein
VCCTGEKERRKMRKVLALCAIAAAVGVVVPTDVSAAPVRATLSGSITEAAASPCCGVFARTEGVGTLPGIGRVSFVADWTTGCDLGLPTTCFTTEKVVLTAKNGDTLTLSGGSNVRDNGGLVVPWNVAAGTGRFASISGSGTFRFTIDFSTSTGTVAVTGALSR